ncbi:hypothetical protein CK203_103446 [Vitis vinifera]|uniref:Ubiquitin-like protease family profile domain-containing protein n=1 Tax=Vitis vinifera TaxID=29760 RepID=A0A438D795_VITVI|nr:hypothetical protein CK203_103446 [Vitis vinifera]
MYDFFLTRFDFKCLGPSKLVDNKVVIMHYRILNGMDKENRKHFLSPNFAYDVENKRGTDCGIFVIKFMQLGSNGGLSRAISNVFYCAK